MTKQELAAACDRLGAYFGKTIPTVQLDEWFKALRHRDGGQALESAVDRVLVECDAIPRNVPKALAGFIADWKAEHPARTATGQREKCPHCWGGDGFIFSFAPNDPELKYRTCCPCGHCRPNAKGAHTRKQLEDAGFVIEVPKTPEQIYNDLSDDFARRFERMFPKVVNRYNERRGWRRAV